MVSAGEKVLCAIIDTGFLTHIRNGGTRKTSRRGQEYKDAHFSQPTSQKAHGSSGEPEKADDNSHLGVGKRKGQHTSSFRKLGRTGAG